LETKEGNHLGDSRYTPPMTENTVLEKIRRAALTRSLSADATDALIAFARDPHGIETGAAASMIASALDTDNDTALGLINKLLGQNLIAESNGPNPRYVVDYTAVTITGDEREMLVQRRRPFADQGAPHSDDAMCGLERFFVDNPGPIYIAIEITDPVIFFKLLDARCQRHRRTTFFVPRKESLDPNRQRHYDDILRRWIQVFKDGPSVTKKLIDLRITKTAFEDLYTSSLSEDSARFDVRFLDSGTTRDGRILEVKSGTSLYVAIRERYAIALSGSLPLWRVWPFRAIWGWTLRNLMTGVLLVVAVVMSRFAGLVAAFVAAFTIKVLVHLAADRIGTAQWHQSNLFKN
jgi:hypothetical protein